MTRHPATATWQFPPAERPPLPAPLERTNLRELVARPARFEHHLLVCATLGRTQLEIVTASEPLYFGHVNISDELALPLPSGDAMVDHFPMRTFLSDPATGEDLGRYNHRVGDLVLNPVGYLHWPGRLRPPYAPLDIPPGMRRCGLVLVWCASERVASTAPLLAVTPGRDADVKPYATPAPAMALASMQGPPGVVATIGTSTLALVDHSQAAGAPGSIAPPRGGWVVVLEAGGEHAPCDLIRVPAGATLDATGIVRALVLADPTASPEPPPPSWRAVPEPPFAPFEDAPPGVLPFTHGELVVEDAPAGTLAVTVRGATAAVPRYWLARMLFRVALHDLRLGYVETYGGLFVDDAAGAAPEVQLGLRGKAAIAIPRGEALGVIERLYRAVAPAGYRERLQ